MGSVRQIVIGDHTVILNQILQLHSLIRLEEVSLEWMK